VAFTVLLQLAIHLWQAKPAPRFPALTDGKFRVIAHRGGDEIAPAGTLEAMRSALENGADTLEMDIRSSSDGHLVVFHDPTLDRTTSCSGAVTAKTLAELQNCDKGRSGFRIPTLEKIFSTFSGQYMVIEIKQENPSLVNPFCKMVRRHQLQDRIIVGSFHQASLQEFRLACPEVATSATPAEVIRFVLPARIGLGRIVSPRYAALQIPPLVPLPGPLPDFEVVTPSLVRQAHAKGLAVQVWTVNDTAQMKQLLAIGVDGIMTDHPSELRKVDEMLKCCRPSEFISPGPRRVTGSTE